MTLKIIKHYIFFLIMFLCCAKLVSANLEITEIMYDPVQNEDYNEWIEIHNTDTSKSVNLTDLIVCNSKIKSGYVEKESLNVLNDKGMILSGGQYAVITDGGSGTEVYSNFIISNNALSFSVDAYSICGGLTNSPSDDTGKEVLLGGSFSDSMVYHKSSEVNNGNSLQKINNDWVSSSPTPGKENSNVEENEDGGNTEEENDDINDSENYNNTSSSSNSSTHKEIPIILKITTQIISPKTVIAGIPFSLNSLTTTNRGQTYLTGKFVWNFGDGMKSELRKGLPFEYTYEYPGEYALNLTYFESYLSESSSASDRVIIKVVPSEIYINGVGDSLDPFVEIGNKSSNEIYLSNWTVTAGIHYFVIPEGTTLLPGKKIKLSPKITGFTGEDIRSVVITNPNNIISATYPTIVKKIVQRSTKTNENNYDNQISVKGTSQTDYSPENSKVINLNDLEASASGSRIKISNSAFPFIGLFVIIGLGIASFLILKKKDGVKDYLEKEIRAEDMTIIE